MQCIACKENTEEKNHAALLTFFIETLLDEQNLRPSQLDAVAVSVGPGSYTGLRIGMSTAKGLCYGANIPLITVPTLHAIADGFVRKHRHVAADALICPMIDARRMEVYTALFDAKGNIVEETAAVVITKDTFGQYLADRKVYFIGNGAFKCKELLSSPNACFPESFFPSAEYLLPDAMKTFRQQAFADVAYAEPFYLKDFIAGKPKQFMEYG
jgi:tRNA threonylcarbamoyladenosine biosynthesis protein TsaB